MFDETIETFVREAVGQALEDGAAIDVADDGSLETGLALMLAGDPEGLDLWLTFFINAPAYETDPTEADREEPEYLVISLWIPANEILPPDAPDQARALALLNTFNQEPGIKCRIDADTLPLPSDAPVVIESDLAVDSIISARPIVRAIERLADFATTNLPTWRNELAL
jgi:hypothetical protein